MISPGQVSPTIRGSLFLLVRGVKPPLVPAVRDENVPSGRATTFQALMPTGVPPQSPAVIGVTGTERVRPERVTRLPQGGRARAAPASGLTYPAASRRGGAGPVRMPPLR